MNIYEAFRWLEQGKAVRRAACCDTIYFSVTSSHFAGAFICDLNREDYDSAKNSNLRTWESSFSKEDIEAVDWKIYERPVT